MNDDSSKPGTRSKVSSVIRRYELEGEGKYIEELWVGEREDRMSLRELADYLNVMMIHAAVRRSELEVFDGTAENIYRLLTDEDVSSGVQIQTRNQLETAGIDVDKLERDLVSRQAIHTYLTKVRGVEYANEDTPTIERIQRSEERIQRLTSKLTAVVEESLKSLTSTGDFTLGSFDVIVSIRVHCEDCREQFDVLELLSKRSCGCDPS